MIPPRTSAVLADMIRAGRRNRRLIPHLLKVLGRFSGRYLALRTQRIFNRETTLAIAMLEHMGDIVAAEPISRQARKTYPSARIFWIVRKPYAAIVENFEPIDNIIPVHCMTEWLLLWSSGIFNLAWDLHISERPCGHCGIFYRKPGHPGELTYRTYYNYGNLLTVNCLVAGIPVIDESPVLRTNESAVAKVDHLNLPERFVVVHGKSNEDNRDWVLAKWQELIYWITADPRFHVIEIGTKSYLIQQPTEQSASLCGQLSILETAEVIRRAMLFIGIDSGPAHLANAVGTPGIILLGRYQAFPNYTPYSGFYATPAGVDLLRAQGPAANLTLTEVRQAVSRRLGLTLPVEPAPALAKE